MKMMRKLVWILAALAALSFESPARASADNGGCGQTMKTYYNAFTNCDSMGLISPGNDTRINLIYLLSDARAQKLKMLKPSTEPYSNIANYWPSDWSTFWSSIDLGPMAEMGTSVSESGEGTICVSDETGSSAFLAAVASDKNLSDAEKTVLTDARKAVKCSSAAGGDAALTVQSPAAQEFAEYIYAIRRFYFVTHYDPSGFAALANATQPWVREAAHYMQARVSLLAAQAQAFDKYGTLQKDGVSKEMVTAALDGLMSYLKEYPKGSYATSATGLIRRAYWISGDNQKLATAYSDAMARSTVDAAGFALVNEIDLKLPVDTDQNNSADVLLLATEDLRMMREQMDSNDKVLPGMKAEMIEAQHSRFAGHDDIYSYLLAARAWFVDKDAKAVLQLLPEKAAAGDALSYVEFSGQLLRASALDSIGDKTARVALVNLFPKATQAFQRGTLEMALVLIDERSKNISAVFAPDSLVQQPALRRYVLDYIAGPILLRQQAVANNVSKEERETALFRLFARDLTQGHFKGFLDDIKMLPGKPVQDADGNPYDQFEPFRWEGNKDGYICPNLIEVARLLNTDERSIKGRLCLGEFIRAQGDFSLPEVQKDELGGTGTLFSGKQIFRQEIYMDIMKSAKASRDEKAFALDRAVRCYEPAHSNDCGGAEVAESRRKKWYNELKTKYGDTSYAKLLRYYW
jgi:hypothetical protein